MFGLISRRRYNDLYARYQAALKATAEARAQRDTAVYNRGQILTQNAGLHGANRRLEGRNAELLRRNSTSTEYAAGLERRVARLLKVGKRVLAAWWAEKRRADHLQQRLDAAMGLNTAPVLAGSKKEGRS
ncbi:hypothetical protein [Streptomyces sp. NPDC058424]|uniref:hypothetical protein n=1 Tax=Streptomyces sp. NPDC058424 TaxID=3346491 RepID=UPI0036516663